MKRFAVQPRLGHAVDELFDRLERLPFLALGDGLGHRLAIQGAQRFAQRVAIKSVDRWIRDDEDSARLDIGRQQLGKPREQISADDDVVSFAFELYFDLMHFR